MISVTTNKAQETVATSNEPGREHVTKTHETTKEYFVESWKHFDERTSHLATISESDCLRLLELGALSAFSIHHTCVSSSVVHDYENKLLKNLIFVDETL